MLFVHLICDQAHGKHPLLLQPLTWHRPALTDTCVLNYIHLFWD